MQDSTGGDPTARLVSSRIHDFSHLSSKGEEAIQEVEALLGTKRYETGSRTISPRYAHWSSDFDFLFLIPPEMELYFKLEEMKWAYMPIYSRLGGSFYKTVAGQRLNLIMTFSPVEYGRWVAATEEGKRQELKTRDERVELFRVLVDRESIPPADPMIAAEFGEWMDRYGLPLVSAEGRTS